MDKRMEYESKEQLNEEYLLLQKKDLVASVIVFAFGLYSFLSGLQMCFFAVTGTKVWYYSPGFLPAFIGLVLMILATIMFCKKYANGVRITNEDVHRTFQKLFSFRNWRLITAIVFLAIYVFLMIGRIPFAIATFLYLSVNFITFRTRNIAIWKLLLISAITTAAVYVFFGMVAAIPLP